MNLYSYFRDEIASSLAALAASGKLPGPLDASRLTVEPPRDASHGDVSTNAALVMAKDAGMKPRDFAGLLAGELARRDDVATADIAGPGFINLKLKPGFWHDRLRDILTQGERYGASTVGQGRAVNVEYVSANPTGPMHVGHGRGAVVGDVLANLLAKVGYKVTREYYINDAGGQIEKLVDSASHRLREIRGENPGPMPADLYPGEYITEIMQSAVEHALDFEGPVFEDSIAKQREVLRDYVVNEMMMMIQEDLELLGVHHDMFRSERKEIVGKGRVGEVVKNLTDRDLVYTGILDPPKGMKPDDWEPRPQLLFRSTKFGDDVDRPLQKSDGSWTYFASDIAYHLDKIERGFGHLIDVWGADHGGYVKRMQAAVKAVSDGKASLEVKLCQLVNLMERGEPVKMSKRAGTFITLRDVIERLGEGSWAGTGAGIVRFIMLTRKHDQHLDFDFAKVTEQSKDNPLFYVQYAHARTCSAFRQAKDVLPDLDVGDAALARADLARLGHTEEIGLIKALAGWPRLLEGAADTGEPHRVAFFLYDLASTFHALWTHGKEDSGLRFVVADDRALSSARLALVRAVGHVIASGLRLIGVDPVEEMR